MIELKAVDIVQGSFRLDKISLQIPDGSYCVIMGPSGCGKTSVLEALCGLRKISAGTIAIGGRDVTNLRPGERNVAYVPQDRALFPGHLVREQLAFSLVVRRYKQEDISKRVEELADLLNVQHLLDRMPDALSGGEAQRVALGRALAMRPSVLCLDEPLSALDADLHKDMCALLKNVHRQTGVTVCHVTHNSAEAEKLSDIHIKMKINEQGHGVIAQ